MKLFGSYFGSRAASVLAVILMIACAPVALIGQQGTQIISDRSSAVLFLGTPDNPTSFNVGAARVNGDVQIVPDDISSSRFNFTIHAANQANDYQNSYEDQPVISFHSQAVEQREDGTLEVRGQLTVTQVFSQVTTSTGEDYSGPVYGPATVFRTSHEATFIFTAIKSGRPGDNSDGRVVSAQLTQKGAWLTATAKVNGEAFPELSRSIQEVAWPIPVNDENCGTPTSIGEDYSGATCTGTAVQQPGPAPVLLVQAGGEDYAGIQAVPPAGDQVTIQLKLELANAVGTPTVGQQESIPATKGNTASQQQAQ